jgi:hypothetical protein
MEKGAPYSALDIHILAGQVHLSFITLDARHSA